jgi:Sporulation and spore germination
VSVPSEEPLKGAVGKIIQERDNADFSLSGYRVTVKNGVATVDLRVSPESKRQLTSLSSCEQFALFGSLKKTLTSNPKWNVKDVRFTEKGEELAL